MNVELIPCLNDNYSYLIYEKNSKMVAIVDPSDFKTCDRIINKYEKLDFILNTHHHADHVDGNQKLKKKYNSKVIGFKKDKERIPGIDIVLEDNQEFEIGNLSFKIIFIPGHTKGHIAFYFEKENVIFTGDTLFSLGCGRVFEGSHKDMFNSLNKLKVLPLETKIYCGHEYTKKNLDFCLKYDTENPSLTEKAKSVIFNVKKGLPTIPTTLKEELNTNIFLRCNNLKLKKVLNLEHSSDLELFSKLRDLKDDF
mgnify:CR=1 FL=1